VKLLAINWQKLLSDPKLLSFLDRVVEKNIQSIMPSVSQSGEIVYPALELSSGDAIKLLDALSAEGVLERKSETRLLGCPNHEDSLDLVPRLKCPQCSSMLIRKGTLLQHNCGFIGNQEVFVSSCPKCGKPVPPQSLRAMGTLYECEVDKQRFAAPNYFLYCKKYDHDFPIQNAVIVDKPSYRLTPESQKDLKERLGLIISLKRGLESGGRTVQIFGSIPGASGVQHTFDLVVERSSSKIPVDIKLATDSPVGVAGVLATYAKALDTKSKPSVLIAVPNASEDAKKSARAYGMLIIEGSDSSSILRQLSQALEKTNSEFQKVTL
jgi:hypothetical protein